jgi:hypothetical protein
VADQQQQARVRRAELAEPGRFAQVVTPARRIRAARTT